MYHSISQFLQQVDYVKISSWPKIF